MTDCRRSKRFELKLAPREREALRKLAGGLGMSQADLLRRLIALELCDGERYGHPGDGRCLRVIALSSAAAAELRSQANACYYHREYCCEYLSSIERRGYPLTAEQAEMLLEGADSLRRIDNHCFFLGFALDRLEALCGDGDTGFTGRFGLTLSGEERAALRAAAGRLGTTSSGLARALVALAAASAEPGSAMRPIADAGTPLFLDTGAVAAIADQVRCVGYVFNDARKGLATVAAREGMAASTAMKLVGNSLRKIDGVASELKRLVDATFELERHPVVRLEGCKHAGRARG